MLWILASVGIVVVAIIAANFRRRWVVPWRELETVIREVTSGRSPSTFLIDGNPVARRIGIALEDLLARERELTARAHEGELNVRTIVSAMRDGLAVIDDSGQVRLLNAASRRLFAIAEERGVTSVLETFRDGVVANVIQQTLRSGTTATESIKLSDTSNGARRVIVTSMPIPSENGAARGAVVLFHDVTQLQQLEEVRRDFVSNVSHELRTPLSIFRGYLETLLDEPELDSDERIRILQVLEKHAARLNSLVDDLLSLARLEAPDLHLQLEAVDVPAFLRRVTKEWEKKAAAKQLQIVLESADDLPALLGDEVRLEEVLHNLLENAVKYTNAGQITVRAERAGEHAVAITVSDQGTGIAPSDLPRIFERFYRADKARSREFGGTGLGLAIVKHIAQLHGGGVDGESQLGRGTTIRVTLPVAAL